MVGLLEIRENNSYLVSIGADCSAGIAVIGFVLYRDQVLFFEIWYSFYVLVIT